MPRKPKYLPTMKDNEAQPKKKASSNVRGYGTQHQHLRELVLANHPICQQCKARFSEHAHHLRYGDNLGVHDYLALCRECHQQIHAHEH